MEGHTELTALYSRKLLARVPITTVRSNSAAKHFVLFFTCSSCSLLFTIDNCYEYYSHKSRITCATCQHQGRYMHSYGTVNVPLRGISHTWHPCTIRSGAACCLLCVRGKKLFSGYLCVATYSTYVRTVVVYSIVIAASNVNFH